MKKNYKHYYQKKKLIQNEKNLLKRKETLNNILIN